MRERLSRRTALGRMAGGTVALAVSACFSAAAAAPDAPAQKLKGRLRQSVCRWCLSHYHTGGVPGRGEIDDSLEINCPAVMRAIADTGFKGFVGQEFVPKRPDALASLKQGVQICDV